MLYRPFLRMIFIRGPIYLRHRSKPVAFWLRSRERTIGQVFCTKVWTDPSNKSSTVFGVRTVRIWTILSHPQNLYGLRVFSILKTIFDILFPAAVSAFL